MMTKHKIPSKHVIIAESENGKIFGFFKENRPHISLAAFVEEIRLSIL